MTNADIAAGLSGRFPGSILSREEFRGDLTLVVAAADILPVCRFLKSEPGYEFTMVVDLCGVDTGRVEGRFEVVYNLYSLSGSRYLRLKTRVEQQDPALDSVTPVWSGANWHERETFDMYGIRFRGHPDLRRLYMPEEFAYHPLRKDFPLLGVPDSIPLPRP
ncbi:MAG: NADH-quinone oxidoreductase subunit C [Bacteroidota bacterium]